MRDSVKRARKHAKDVLDPGYPYYGTPELVREMADEIARLRLTDEEREALVEMALVCDNRERKSLEFKLPEEAARWRGMAATLRGLLAARSETTNV